ncbi:MAG TPA: Holliday junction resolvase Hjc, partial [Candidatus Diapherotrites archaeon]|nr:Holliday junction resolvase Hjc [Candidatus Diapherotrites archaeon]
VRVAGSGSISIPTPDILAIKHKKGCAIECKTKSGEYLNIKESQIQELNIFEKRTGFKSYIAWRLEKDNWYFITPEKINKTKKAYSIKREEIKEKGMTFDKFISLISEN